RRLGGQGPDREQLDGRNGERSRPRRFGGGGCLGERCGRAFRRKRRGEDAETGQLDATLRVRGDHVRLVKRHESISLATCSGPSICRPLTGAERLEAVSPSLLRSATDYAISGLGRAKSDRSMSAISAYCQTIAKYRT